MKTQAELGFLVLRRAIWLTVKLQQLLTVGDGSLGASRTSSSALRGSRDTILGRTRRDPVRA